MKYFLLQVKLDEITKRWSGMLHIGLTSMSISDSTPVSILPATILDFKAKPTWIVCGSEVKRNGVTIKENYAPSLDRLEVVFVFLFAFFPKGIENLNCSK